MINISSPGNLSCGCKIFNFYTDDYDFKEFSNKCCGVCGTTNLNANYVEIIEKLKEAKLIPEDDPLLCCMCYFTRNIFNVMFT